jgi:hypothetical protein
MAIARARGGGAAHGGGVSFATALARASLPKGRDIAPRFA